MLCRFPKFYNKKVADLCNSIQKKFIKKLDEMYNRKNKLIIPNANANINANANANYNIHPYIGSTFIILYVSTMAYFFFER